jgi:hypothetical protein
VSYQTVSLPFGAGVDTKTDPKMLTPPKVTRLQDGVFTNYQRISKRPGKNAMTTSLVGGGTWSNPTMDASYRNELLLAATTANGQRLLSYSQALGAWQDRGKYISIGVNKTIVNNLQYIFAGETTAPSNSFGTYNSSFVASGNIGLFAFDGMSVYGAKNATNATFITVVDLETGAHLADSVQIINALGFSKAAILGASTLAVFYISSSTSNELCVRIISVSAGGGVSVGPEQTIGPCSTGSSGQFPYSYDYMPTNSGAIVAVASEAGGVIDLYAINTSGGTTISIGIAVSGNITCVSITPDNTGNAWIYWVAGGANLYYAIYSPTLSAILTATKIVGSLSNVMQVTALPVVTSRQSVYFSQYVYTSTTSSVIISNISTVSVTSAGSIGSVSTPLYGADIYGKPFTVNSRSYLPCITLSQSQSTGFLVDTTDYIAAAKFLQTSAEGVYQAGLGITGGMTNPPAVLIGGRLQGFINSTYTLPDGTSGIGAGYVVSVNQTVTSIATNLSSSPENITNSVALGTALISFNFNHIDAYQSLVQQDTLILNGGIVSMYDGASVCELQYNVDPDNVGVTASSSGGNIAAVTLNYYITWEWVDANGNLYESAPSLPVKVIFTTGSSNEVLIQTVYPPFTQKQFVSAKLWRSDSSEGGNIAYLVAISPANSSNFPYIEFTDKFASATVINNETLYTENGAILENIAPPPMMIMWTNYNRAWGIDSENPETNIEYTKTASTGTGVSFSTGQLEIVIDSKNGAMTGASPMDEKTVIFKQNGLGYFIGDGANDAGTGSSITNFQFIPSDTGCSNSKSVILYPDGILFRASNNKGIYEVSRGIQMGYFGLDVQAFNNQDIQAAQIIGNKNQIRFLTSSGLSLLYDYVMKQWSTFTNYTGLSSAVYNGIYTYVSTDGNIYQEDSSGTYLDNGFAYPLLVQLSWIKAGSIQGYQRTRRFGVLGYFQTSNSGHGVQASIAYDFQPNFSNPVPYYFSGLNAPFQYRERLARQKCDAFQILIQEVTTGASGEYIELSDLELEILAKQGINKLPRTQTVG